MNFLLTKNYKKKIIFFLFLLQFFAQQKCFANSSDQSHTKITEKSQDMLINGISARLIPEQSQTISFPGACFSFGVYKEYLNEDTQNNYAPTGLGVVLGFDQPIRDIWRGGVEMRWSDWMAKNNSVFSTSPLSLFSKIAATPNLKELIKSESLAQMVRPYVTGGLGYTLFFDNRSFLAAQTKSAFGQISAIYGAGVKIVLPKSTSIRIGAEQWRGIQTSNYFSTGAFLELSFGDVNEEYSRRAQYTPHMAW